MSNPFYTATLSPGTGAPLASSVIRAEFGDIEEAFDSVTVSPALTGVPTAPTAAPGTSSTQIATTEFVASLSFSSSLPGQSGAAGKYLGTDGTTASWSFVPSVLPTQTGNSGKYLTTNGTAASWGTVASDVPSQTGNSGKYLTTNGTIASWSTVTIPVLPAYSAF